MATRALIGYLDPETKALTSTYNHSDGYPENLGLALNNHYDNDKEAFEIANYGYISYLDPETGEITAKNKSKSDYTSLRNMSYEDAMYEIAGVADSYGADYVYIYNPVDEEWLDVKMYGIAQTADALGVALASLKSVFGPDVKDIPAGFGQVNEDYITKWKKFLNEESPLYNDMGEVSDTIYDYADRMRGSDVEDVEELVYYYQNNPDEIPEPMDAKFFVQYADEIAQAINDQERYESGDVD